MGQGTAAEKPASLSEGDEVGCLFEGTLPPTNMATDRGSPQKDMTLPGTSPQLPC